MRLISSIFIILLTSTTVEGWRPFILKVRDLTYTVMTPSIIDFEIVNMTLAEKPYFSGYADIKKHLYHGFFHLDILTNFRNGEPFNLVYLNNICADIAYKMLSEYIQLPKECPIWKKLYKVDNITYNEDLLPPVLPEREAMFMLSGWIVERGKEIMIGKGHSIVWIKNKYKKIL